MPDPVALEMPRAISADILPSKQGPSLSATSDMPVTVPEIIAAVEAKDGKAVIPTDKPAEGVKADDKLVDKPKDEVKAEPKDAVKPEPVKAKEPDDIPAYAKREITIARNQKRDADARAKTAEEKADRAEKALARALELAEKVTGAPAKDAADKMPKRDAFDTPALYDAELEAWIGRQNERAATTAVDRQKAADAQAEADRLKAEADTAQQEEVRGRAITFQEKAAKFRERASDYDDIVMKPVEEGGPVITNNMSMAILESDNGPEIAYYFGKHKDEAQRVANLTPARQVYEVGRISLRLENEATDQAKEAARIEAESKISKAPAPIVPVGTANGHANSKSADEESMEEYAKRRTAEMVARNKAERGVARPN